MEGSLEDQMSMFCLYDFDPMIEYILDSATDLPAQDHLVVRRL